MTSGINPGVPLAFLAYVIWGLFPLYFKQVAAVPAMEVVAHRTVWSLVLVIGLLTAMRRWSWLGPVLRQPKILGSFVASSLFLATNWLVYVWSVQHGHVLDASLGYFINPLVNVALGFFFLHERPRPWQWLAVGLAALGVLWLALQAGHAPWIALVLAGSFGVYGLLRKIAPLAAVEGLALETLVLAPFAVLALIVWTAQGQSAFVTGDPTQLGWLLLGGPLTAGTLLLFAAGARRIPLATLGLVQYVSPSLQFGLGVWLYGEPVNPARMIGFALIWTALAVYSLEGLWVSRRAASVPDDVIEGT